MEALTSTPPPLQPSTPMLLPDDVWLRTEAFDAARVDAWLALLSDEERARYAAFRVEKRRREFLLGRVTLRRLLAERLSEAPSAILLHVTEAGAIEVPGAPYHVSLAHADDRAVAVVGRRRVGVDLEPVRPCTPRVIDFVLRPDERDLLDTLPMDREHAFILCWTLKEATLKALGTGFYRAPKKVRLEIDASARRAALRAWDESRWAACFEDVDGAILSVVYEVEAAP